MRAEFVIEDDAIHSKSRAYLDVVIRPEYTDQMFITGRLRMSDMQPFESPLPCFMTRSAGFFAIFPRDHEVEDLSFFAMWQRMVGLRKSWRRCWRTRRR